MKNAKELQAVLSGIYLLNRMSEVPNLELDKLCEYAFRHCLESNTALLMVAAIGQDYLSMKEQVNGLLQRETKFAKEMGGLL